MSSWEGRILSWMLYATAVGSFLAVALGIVVGLWEQMPSWVVSWAALFSPDGMIDHKTIGFLQDSFVRNGPIFLLSGAGILCLALAGRKLGPAAGTKLAEDAPVHRPGRHELVALAVILGLGVVCRLLFMGRGFFYDELYLVTHYLQRDSWRPIIEEFWLTNHIGYTFLAFLTGKVGGMTEWAVRWPALVLGMLGIGGVWFWARRYFSIPVALGAAAFLALSPAHAIWSASARGYAGYVLCALMFLFLYGDMLQRPSSWKKWAWVALALLGSAMHAYFIFFIVAVAVSLIWRVMWKKEICPGSLLVWEGLGWTLFTAAVIFLPLTARTWVELSGSTGEFLGAFPLTLFQDILVAYDLPVLVLMGALVVRGFHASGRGVNFLKDTLVLSLIFALVIWLARPCFLYARFWAGLLPPLFIFMAVGLGRVSEGRFGKIAGVLAAIIVVVPWGAWQQGKAVVVNEATHAFREAARDMAHARTAGTGFCAVGQGRELFQFYADRPVVQLKDIAGFEAFRQGHAGYACFTIPHFSGQTPGEAALIRRLAQQGVEKKYGMISVFHAPP